jgi:hypothetical protein
VIELIPKGRVMPRRLGDLDRDHAPAFRSSIRFWAARMIMITRRRRRLPKPTSGRGDNKRLERIGTTGRLLGLSRRALSNGVLALR